MDPTQQRVGHPVQLTLRIVASNPTGTVSFSEQGRGVFSTVTLVNGQASTTYVPTTLGTHHLQWAYSGDATYAPSGDNFPWLDVVAKFQPGLTVSRPSDPVLGTFIVFTLSIGHEANQVPTGTLSVQDDAGSSWTLPLVSGAASLAYHAPTLGEHRFNASYSGDSVYYGTSTSWSQGFDGPYATITLASSSNPGLVGHPVTLTAKVGPPGLVGTVTFWVGSGQTSDVLLGQVPLVNGSAPILYTLPTTAGTTSIYARYSGDTTHIGDGAQLFQQTVSQLPTSVALTAPANPVPTLTTILNVRVTPNDATGTVTVFDGVVSLGTFMLTNGQFSFPYHAPRFGGRNFEVDYSGDPTHVSSSVVASIAFHGLPTTMQLAASATSVAPHEPVTLRATVTPSTLDGEVNFMDSGVPIGSAPVVDGVAALPTSLTGKGPHTLSATFPGDTTYDVCSAATDVTVVGSTTTTTLTSSGNPAGEGQTLRWTVTISPFSPSGQVQLFIDGSLRATLPIATGSASYDGTLPVGEHLVVAHYMGTAGSEPSDSPPIVQYVSSYGAMPVLFVLSPNGDERWALGSTVTLRWNPAPGVSKVTLYSARNEGLPDWQPIAEGVPNNGSYTWTLAGPATNLGGTERYIARFAVVDLSGHVGSDASDLGVSIYDLATATLIQRFEALHVADGVLLTWMLAGGVAPDSLGVERAPAPTGPWSKVKGERCDADGLSTVLDRSATGAADWYRLVELRGGASIVVGTLQVSTGLPATFALGAAWPNPTHGAIWVDLALPRAAAVVLSLIDVQGRQVAELERGMLAAGRHRIAWDGLTPRGPLASGIYFLRYETPDRSFVKRLVLSR